ncbi:MAG: glycosyltransferase [Candidatus Gastranaerophilaceae bacterium]
MAKLSIVIPIHNADAYLERCLNSVVSQTLKDIEIICVDDNSKDKSSEILQSFAKKDARVRILTLSETSGQSHARNVGISEAQGEFIGFVDADDFVDCQMFEKMVENAVENSSDIVMCKATVYDTVKDSYFEDDEYFNLSCFSEKFDKKTFSHKDTLAFWEKINVAVWNKIYRFEFLKSCRVKFQEGYIYEDLPFFYATYTKAKKVSLVREFLYFYRINSENSTMAKTDEKVKDRVDMVSLTVDILKEQKYFRDIKAAVINWAIHDLYYRFLLIDTRYQKEYFFRMQKFFRTINTSDVDNTLIKSPYYPYFCQIKENKYDECIKFFFNKETMGEMYVQQAKVLFENDLKQLGERRVQIEEIEKENLKKKYDLEDLQERILQDEKDRWAAYYKQKEADAEAFERTKKEFFDGIEKQQNEITEEWKNIDAKNTEIAFEKQDLANSWQRLEDETLRQKQQNELELIKSENKLTNKYLEDVAEEKARLAKELKDEIEKDREYYSELMKSQIELQQKNYEKISSFKKKIEETEMTRPKVSIILPVYNVAPYLRQSLDSIIAQTLSDIEIICVDDGSTDESGQILDEYKEKDDRIKVIRKKNAGTGAARNDGLKIATGECIGFVDPDDWILPNMYERLYNLLQDKGLDIVMFTPDVYNDKTGKHEGFLYFQDSNFPKFLDDKVFNKDDISPFSYPMCVWNKLYRKRLFDENNIEFAEGLDFEDHKVIFKSLFTAKRIYFIREKLYVYRHSREGSILSDNDKRMFDHIKIYDIVENILKETGNWEKFHLDFLRYKVHNILYYYTMIKPRYKKDYYNKMVKSLRSTIMSREEIDILSKDYPDLKPIIEDTVANRIKNAVKKIVHKKG